METSEELQGVNMSILQESRHKLKVWIVHARFLLQKATGAFKECLQWGGDAKNKSALYFYYHNY